MSIRDRIREDCSRYLGPDEQIQEVMWGVSVAPWKVLFFSWAGATYGNYRAVVCTTKRILLFENEGLGVGLNRILESTSRNQPLGPPRGLLHRLSCFEHPVWIGTRFYGDIRKADARLADETHNPNRR